MRLAQSLVGRLMRKAQRGKIDKSGSTGGGGNFQSNVQILSCTIGMSLFQGKPSGTLAVMMGEKVNRL